MGSEQSASPLLPPSRPPTRALVIVDAENLASGLPERVAPALAALSACLPNGSESDLLVIGVHPRLAFVVHEWAPEARVVTGPGRNGADLRLCRELADGAFIAERFERVVVASGDHIFAQPVQILNHLGLETVVVARARSLARELRLVAQRVIWLNEPQIFTLVA